MKKGFCALLTLLMIIGIFFTGCSRQEVKTVKYYNPIPLNYDEDYVYDEELYENQFPTGIELSSEQLQVVKNIYQNLIDTYNIKKEFPNVRILTDDEMAEFASEGSTTYGMYSPEDKTLYLSQNAFTDDFYYSIAHEIMHYFADNSGRTDVTGIRYTIDGRMFGSQLDEGITNYFSSKVYAPPKTVAIYTYATHVAEMLAKLYGEDELLNCYLASDRDWLRNQINTSLDGIYSSDMRNITNLEFDSYDLFNHNLEVNFMCLKLFNLANTEQDFIQARGFWSMAAVNCEEMLLLQANNASQKKQLTNGLEEFLNTATDKSKWTHTALRDFLEKSR